MTADTSVGTPITATQAARAILREIRSPIVSDLEQDSVPRALQRLSPDGTIFPMLSRGEQRLIRIANSLWNPTGPHGADLADIGGLDRTLRRKVVIVLAYLHLGRDLVLDVDEPEFDFTFGSGENLT